MDSDGKEGHILKLKHKTGHKAPCYWLRTTGLMKVIIELFL